MNRLSLAGFKVLFLSFESLILMCLSICLFDSSYLEFIEFLTCLFFIKCGRFQPLFFQVFSPASFSSLSERTLFAPGCPTVSAGSVHFPWIFFFLLLRLNNFYLTLSSLTFFLLVQICL